MTGADLEREVTAMVERAAAAGVVVRAQWLVHEIVAAHEANVEGSDKEWFVCNAYANVRALVGRVVRRYRPAPMLEPPQLELVLPGFKRVQTMYTVERQGDECVVATPLCTDEELLAKIDELERMGAGCYEHAEELRRYLKNRKAAEAA